MAEVDAQKINTMEASDILYIIVTIVVILSSIFRKKKKPQTPIYGTEEREQDTQYSPLFPDPEPQVAPKPVVEEGVPTTSGYQSITKAHEKLAREEAKLSKKIAAKNKKNKKKVVKKGEKFDARKAVIYSVILERKKY